MGIVYSGIDAEIIIPSQRKKRNKFAIFSLVLIDLCFFGIPEKLDSERMVWTPGRLDSGRLGLWTIAHRTIGHLDSAQMFSVYSPQL